MRPVEIESLIWKSVVNSGSRFWVLAPLVFSLFFSENCRGGQGGALMGYYSAPSNYCTTYDGSGFSSCKNANIDCILINEEKNKDVHLEVFSVQAGGHTCAINGTAKIEGGRIVYRELDSDDREWVLEIIREKSGVIVNYLSAPGVISPFCGAHASLHGVYLKKNKSGGFRCFRDE